MLMRKTAVAAIAAFFVFAMVLSVLQSQLFAQGPAGPKYATVTTTALPSSIARGHSGKLVIKIDIAPGFHLNSAKPNDPDLIATAFMPTKFVGVHFGSAKYPKDEMVKTAAMDKPIPAYTGTVEIVVPYTVDSMATTGKKTLGGILTIQGCNATACYPPLMQACGANVAIR